MVDDKVYKGYIIRQSFTDDLMIIKDNTLISYAYSLEDAKRRIDEIID